jgi:hypothetical protein
MKTCYWFGGSIVRGAELEKCGIPEQDRFTKLVSRHFGWIEQNHASDAASIGSVTESIASTEFVENSVVFVIVPSHCRYYWINENFKSYNIMPHDKNYQSWYKTVDTFGFRKHTIFQQLLLIKLLLEKKNLEFYFINELDRDFRQHANPIYFDQVINHFLLPANQYLLEELNWDFDQGYPPLALQHLNFWPCENHPNVQGHKKLADKIISLINSKISISKD